MHCVIKGNAQFMFLCDYQKSGASRVCITFPQITQKISTKDIIHWLELITETLSFLQIFSVRKTTTQLFKYFRKSARKSKNYISDIVWAFKSKLQIIHQATYIHCFLLNLIMFLYMFSTTHPYLSLLFSHFVFLFCLLFLTHLATRHIILFTMFDDFITTCPYITEIKKHYITKTNTLI